MEELDFRSILDRFGQGGFQKGEQVLLANFGTNQTLLSIIFGEPNEIRVVHQVERESDILREVELYCGGQMVCIANTTIPKEKNRVEVMADILEGKLGLGQIVVKHNLPNKRVLLDIGHDENHFWRTYVIEGPELYLKISEDFSREPFVKVGWIDRLDWPNLKYQKSMQPGAKNEQEVS